MQYFSYFNRTSWMSLEHKCPDVKIRLDVGSLCVRLKLEEITAVSARPPFLFKLHIIFLTDFILYEKKVPCSNRLNKFHYCCWMDLIYFLSNHKPVSFIQRFNTLDLIKRIQSRCLNNIWCVENIDCKRVYISIISSCHHFFFFFLLHQGPKTFQLICTWL